MKYLTAAYWSVKLKNAMNHFSGYIQLANLSNQPDEFMPAYNRILKQVVVDRKKIKY